MPPGRTVLAAAPALPPGWKPRAQYEEEKTFVAPAAMTRVADGVRQLSSDIGDEKKFKGGVISPRILIENPYLDPADPFFNIPRQMACLSDGSLAVFSTAKLHKDGRMQGNPYATGLWRIAPDGAISAIDRARHTVSEGRDPECGVSVGASGLDPAKIGPISVAADGSLVFPYQTGWASGRYARLLRLTSNHRLEAVPGGDTQACAPEAPKAYRETFNDISAAARDPEGNTWLKDGCKLFRVGPDGAVTTVLNDEQVCPKDEPERHVRAAFMAWDPAHGELLAAGTLIWNKPRDLYSTIWRIRPNGEFRRVYLARKVGSQAPQIDGIGGLAVDAKGVIHFGAGLLTQGGGYRILRLVDETKGRTEVVAGAPRPSDINHADGSARQAHFGTIKGLCFVPDGTLFVHDGTHVIRKVMPAGQVTTWAF